MSKSIKKHDNAAKAIEQDKRILELELKIRQIKEQQEMLQREQLKDGEFFTINELLEAAVRWYDEPKNQTAAESQIKIYYWFYDEWLRNQGMSIEDKKTWNKKLFGAFYKAYKEEQHRKLNEENNAWKDSINLIDIEHAAIKQLDVKEKESKPRSLEEIWLGKPEDYEQLITELKKKNNYTETYHVINQNGKNVWNASYMQLRALIQVLTEKRLIKPISNQSQMIRIVNKTFNLSLTTTCSAFRQNAKVNTHLKAYTFIKSS